MRAAGHGSSPALARPTPEGGAGDGREKDQRARVAHDRVSALVGGDRELREARPSTRRRLRTEHAEEPRRTPARRRSPQTSAAASAIVADEAGPTSGARVEDVEREANGAPVRRVARTTAGAPAAMSWRPVQSRQGITETTTIAVTRPRPGHARRLATRERGREHHAGERMPSRFVFAPASSTARSEPPVAPVAEPQREQERATTTRMSRRTSAWGARSRSPKRGTTRTSRRGGQRSQGGA